MEMNFFHHTATLGGGGNPGQLQSPRPSTNSSAGGGSEFNFPASSSNNEVFILICRHYNARKY